MGGLGGLGGWVGGWVGWVGWVGGWVGWLVGWSLLHPLHHQPQLAALIGGVAGGRFRLRGVEAGLDFHLPSA